MNALAPLSLCDADGLFLVERVTLHKVSPNLGFATVRLPQVCLKNLRVEAAPNGAITVKSPTYKDSQGRTWAHYDLQPDCRALVQHEVARLWARGCT